MCKLAPLIGVKLTERVFLDRYIDMCEDEDLMVRRICATHFGEMCAVVSRAALFNKLVSTDYRHKKRRKEVNNHERNLVCMNTMAVLSIN